MLTLASSFGLTQEILDIFWAFDLKIAIKILVESSLLDMTTNLLLILSLKIHRSKHLFIKHCEALDERAQKIMKGPTGSASTTTSTATSAPTSSSFENPYCLLFT